MTRYRFSLRCAATALCAVWLVAMPTRAALFDDDEARRRIEDTNRRVAQIQKGLDERIAALETQLKSQGLVDLFTQVEQLKAEVAKLRGQIEVLAYEQEQSQKRQRDLYVDIDSRLRKLESGAPANAAAASASGAPGGTAAGVSPGATSPPIAPPPVVGAIAPSSTAATPAATNEQRAYDAAFDQFKSNNFGAAIPSFYAFIKTYPKSPLAASAQYWIGNAYFAQRDYRNSIVSQRQLVAAYPDSQKVPDALLNIATSQFEMGDAATSRRTLEDLIARFPQSEAAGKARQRLAIR